MKKSSDRDSTYRASHVFNKESFWNGLYKSWFGILDKNCCVRIWEATKQGCPSLIQQMGSEYPDTTYETEVKDFFDIDRHVGVLSP